MAEKNWTPEQRNAIDARGGTVLVSAAAGSGKTAVLVERVIGRMLDRDNPVDADRMLVVTFSNAAALEMKQRLFIRLDELLVKNPQDDRLQRQQMLLERAQISTIHSFCLELIRSGFQQLGIAANTRIADEKELEILRLDCAEQAVEQMYAQPQGEAFSRLVELLSTGRDDRKVFETLFDLYDFIRAHPFYQNWLQSRLALYDPETAPAQSVWGRCLLEYAATAAARACGLYARALRLIAENDAMQKAYGDAFSVEAAQTEQVRQAVEGGDWDAVCTALRRLEKQRLRPLRGDDPAKEQVKNLRDAAWGTLEGLRDKQFCADSAQFQEDLQFLRPLVEALFSLTTLFDRLFTEEKRRKNWMDFSDMEHYAIALLTEPLGAGFRPTALAESVQTRFDEILVDEFQDINAAQEILFGAVSRAGENLFLVGDVKQSIYRFRQACPELFIEKKKRFFSYDGVRFPAKIILAKNFRSAPEVTTGINFFFSMLMSETIGEIDYNEEEMLSPGASYPEEETCGCTLCLFDAGEADAKEAAMLEVRSVAQKIAEMLEGNTMVADGSGGLRRVRPGDFCILLRSPARKAQLYQNALHALGVPVWSEPKTGFLHRREIAPVLSMLRVIVNPLLEIELAAALHSPLFSFSEDELAQIRLAGQKTSLFGALQLRAAAGDAHCAAFVAVLDSLRRMASAATADELLRKLFALTDYSGKVRVMRMGQARQANLMLLVQYAAGYRANGCLGIYGFMRFIDRLCERGGDLSPAAGLSENADVVRVMSIHRSKGLEFPIVFLCNCAKSFNREDIRGSTLLHSELGFTCVRRDFARMIQFSTVPLEATRLELERSMLSEELRMLYVAMTRAKERLVLTAIVKKPAEKLAAACIALEENHKLPAWQTRGAASFLDWLLMAAAHHPAAARFLGDAAEQPVGLATPLEISIEASAPEEAPALPMPVSTLLVDPALLQTLEERLAFVYPFAAQTKIPTKLAVSEIAKGETDASHRFSRQPAFLEMEGLTGAQKGNAMHRFMQFADYRAAAENLPREIARLRERGFLSLAEIDSLDQSRLRAFFVSRLAGRIFAAEKVWRELRFLAEAGQELLGHYSGLFDEGGKTAVQGVADCVFLEEGRAVIVDYKTDRVSQEAQLIERYRTQLDLYRAVLTESLGVPVGEGVLYSFALSCAIRVY